MKKICISLFLISIIILTVAVGVKSETKSAEYLRIHIRANSNEVHDQNVKYLIKDKVIEYLTPIVVESQSIEEFKKALESEKGNLKELINSVLKSHGYSYSSNVVVRNELFPTRVYGEFTLKEGYYDAVIVELGKAEGDNWWCVVYPPLCFTGNESGVKYKSKIYEIIKRYK